MTIIICAFKVIFLLAMINGLFPGSKLESPRDMTNDRYNICPVSTHFPFISFLTLSLRKTTVPCQQTSTPSLMVSRLSDYRLASPIIHIFLFPTDTVSFFNLFPTWNISISLVKVIYIIVYPLFL